MQLLRAAVGWLSPAVLSSLLCQANNLLPNPGFEAGETQPAGWRLAEGEGSWTGTAYAGQRALAVTGRGEDASVWRTEPLPLERAGLYRLSFWGRRLPGTSSGTAVSGSSRVNRDLGLDETWREYGFVLRTPDDLDADWFRLGQWHVNGTMQFDAASLLRVQACHRVLANGIELGAGETLRENAYQFRADFNGVAVNYHRTLATNRAGFNSTRWLFSPGAEVVYRHHVNGHAQQNARLKVFINHHTGGSLQVQASQDGRAWTALGEFNGEKRGGDLELPSSLFPAEQMLVRLSQSSPGAGFQVDTYEYTATLSGQAGDAAGETFFLAEEQATPQLRVELRRFELPDAQGRVAATLAVSSSSQSAGPLRLLGTLDAISIKPGGDREPLTRIAVSQGGEAGLTAPMPPPGLHRWRVRLASPDGRPLFTGSIDARVSLLADQSYGYFLEDRSGLGLWWCESGWKVGRERGLPARRTAESPHVSAAQGEYEALQIVLRSQVGAMLTSARVAPFRRGGKPVGIMASVYEVAYVPVTVPTDSASLTGWYPDPLPPLRGPLRLDARQNQPLWITVHVDRGTPPGEYVSQLEIETSLGRRSAPFRVRVHGFALPQETHLRSALGLGTHGINRYHRLVSAEDKERVFAAYLRNFAEHRISPYSFYDYAPIQVTFPGDGAQRRAQIDFTRFDEAASQWLGPSGFNTFQLDLQGMGGGTFHSRHLGRLAGFEEGTAGHTRLFGEYLGQVEGHLRQKGWLDKAFTYWFDEPDPKDYDFVVEGMKRLKAAAPGVRRMLTEQPEPALMGHVDIWCGLTPEWSPSSVAERRKAGEEVWWYICTGPKAPYVTEFIDHPGTELRLWPWQSWQYGVTGILIWATIYWTSPLAYPDPVLQDPWGDPMSWVSGYGNPVGFRSPWGNGDGRFLYPPRRDPNAAGPPCLDEPINSLRWENLRDGMEDYEYFWLLKDLSQRLNAKGGMSGLVSEAQSLLQPPPDVSADLTHFTTDPRPLLKHRDRLARMIERVQARLSQ